MMEEKRPMSKDDKFVHSTVRMIIPLDPRLMFHAKET